MPNLEDHPLADIFPLMPDSELESLAADIEANGLREPIWVYEGKILDGRNRYRACQAADVDHRVEQYKGKEPLGFVISKNLHRRHLDASQRAMVAANIANLAQGRSPAKPANLPVSQTDAAKLLNVGERTVRDAVKVKEHGAKELVDAVHRGDVSVSAAAEVAELPKAEQRKVVKTGTVKAAAKERREKPKGVAAAILADPSRTDADIAVELETTVGVVAKVRKGLAEKGKLPASEPDEGTAFVASVETLCRDIDQIAARMKSLKPSPFSHSMHLDSAIHQIEAARKTLWQGRPAEACPYCEANETNGCKACNGTKRVKTEAAKRGREAIGGAK